MLHGGPGGKWSTHSAQLPWASLTGNTEGLTLPAANMHGVCIVQAHRPQQPPLKTGCPCDPTASPRQGGLQSMPPAPSVSGGGGGGSGGGQGSAWLPTLLPSGRWSLLPPQLCAEHRLSYSLPRPSRPKSPRGESPRDPSPPPPLWSHRSLPTAPTPLGGSPALCETQASPPNPVHGDHVTARGRGSPLGAPKIRGWELSPAPASGVELITKDQGFNHLLGDPRRLGWECPPPTPCCLNHSGRWAYFST